MSLKIHTILCNPNIMNNYSYIIIDENTEMSAIIDAPEESAIVEKCKDLEISPQYLLITHHHPDHTSANLALKRKFNLKIVGSEIEKDKITGIDITLKDKDKFNLGNSTAEIIISSGHTLGHILWYFKNDNVLFTGDVLFNMCIGGLFEGTPKQMWETIENLKKLPDATKFYPGHEYLKSAIPYINAHILQAEYKEYMEFILEKKKNNEALVGNTLGLEKKCNPFLKINTLNDFEHFMG